MSDDYCKRNPLRDKSNLTKIVRTHEYSCLLDSFAYVTGVAAEEIVYEIGHGGSGEGEPRGFHTQEIIEPLAKRGFCITPIELFPVTQDPETGDQRIVHFGATEDCNFLRFASHLQGHHGVLIGYNQRRVPHATAWLYGLVHDPVGISYPILKKKNGTAVSIYLDKPIMPNMFWRIK